MAANPTQSSPRAPRCIILAAKSLPCACAVWENNGGWLDTVQQMGHVAAISSEVIVSQLPAQNSSYIPAALFGVLTGRYSLPFSHLACWRSHSSICEKLLLPACCTSQWQLWRYWFYFLLPALHTSLPDHQRLRSL
jgi:hypothetical protein